MGALRRLRETLLTRYQSRGTAPQKSGEPWSGSYTVSLGGTFAPACDANLSGTFTATSFPLVSGVYVGTGSTLGWLNGVPKAVPVTLQVTLQQGGTVTNPGNGAASNYFSNALLTGNIKVQGSPCFSSGATQSTPASSVIGNMVSARFLMDDGSTLSLLGPLTDVTEGHISTSIILVQGGNVRQVPLMSSSFLGWIVRVDSIKRCLGLSLTQGLCCCILLLLLRGRVSLGRDACG